MESKKFVNIMDQIKLITEELEHVTNERMANLFIKNNTIKIIVLSKYEIYKYNNQYNYYQMIKSDGELMNTVSETLHKVFDDWMYTIEKRKTQLLKVYDDDTDETKKEQKKLYNLIKTLNYAINQIETVTFLKNTIERIVSKLELTSQDYEDLNRMDNYINFRNYKLNLKTLEYSERTEDDFCTEFLNYDFNPKANKEIKKEIKQILKQICNDSEEDLEFILSYLGYCITSETKEQKYLNVVGPSASNGKSTLIKLMENVFDIYTFKSDKRLFSESFGKSHKYFSGMKNKRIVYIEELDKKKIDGDLLKDTVDGNQLNNEVLFGTTEGIKISFKLLFFSNNFMNFDSDSGIKRRTITVFFNSKFVDKEELEKERATYTQGKVFPKNKSLLDKFISAEYKNAFLHLIIAKARDYFTKGITIPESYKQVTNDFCDENDKMKSFLENNFERTDKEDDKISKDEFKDMYNAYTKCNYAWSTILSDIKRCNLEYNKDRWGSYNGLKNRGVILKLKKRNREYEAASEIEDSEDASETSSLGFIDANGLDFGLPKPIGVKKQLAEVTAERDLYKSKFEELQRQLDELKAQMMAPKPVEKSLLDQVMEIAEVEEIKNESKNDTFKKLKAKIN